MTDENRHPPTDERDSHRTGERELTTTDRLDPAAVSPVVHEVVVILGMIGFVALGTILPGADRELLDTGVAVADVVLGIGTLGIVASMLYAAPKLHALVTNALRGPAAVVDDAASIVQYVAVFLAIVIAHAGFAPVVARMIDPNWVYDLAFLSFALIPLGAITYRFHRAIDPVTAFVTAGLLGERPSETAVTGRNRTRD